MTVDTDHLNTQETTGNRGSLFQFKDYREKSILLKNEYAEGYNGIIEFKKDHLLIALGWLADLLIVQNWVVTKKIVDPFLDNVSKQHLQLISRFDFEKFPFVPAPSHFWYRPTQGLAKPYGNNYNFRKFVLY